MSSQTASSRDNGETLILAIAPAQENASRIEAPLRDAGRNVRVDWLDRPGELGSYLSDHAPALICCHPDDAGEDTPKRLLGLCLNAAPGTPVVLLQDADADTRAELIRGGARAVVPPDAPELLTVVLGRELEVVALRAEAETERQRAAGLERRLQEVLTESQDARATLQEGIHAALNPTYAQLFGFESPDELEGVPLMDLVVPDDRDRVKRKLSDCRKCKDDGEPIRFRGQCADDSHCDVLMHCRLVQIDGEDAVEVLIPQLQPRLSAGAGDAREALHHALSRPEETGGLYVVVIDDLLGLQSRLGLLRADAIVDETAVFLLDAVDDADTCFRYGPGEFVVLTGPRSAEDLHADAERLRAAVDDEVFGDDDTSVSLTVSIAVSATPPGENREPLLLGAVRKAREAAAAGGNRVVLEAESEHRVSNAAAEREYLEALRQALREDRLTFAYQSIASLEGDDTEHFDVLLRLADDQGNLLRPADYGEVAARHELLPEIDRIAVRKVLDLLARRHERGARGTFFLQLSEATLNEAPEFLDWLQGRLASLGFPPDELRFSVTEEALRSNVRRAQQLADGLETQGVALAIERFGSTGKSVQLLERISADFAKLDATVTEALAGDQGDPVVAEAVHAARERGVRLIAQQVADANTMARLWQIGINYVQGQYVQEPDAETADSNVA